MADNPIILHVDADAFYASVEQVLRQDLRGRPVVVGGTERGVVSAASYEARRFGIHSAMPIVHARRLCPHAVFLQPNFPAYKDYSRRMFEILGKYSPAVEVTSIDEGYVDLSGTLKMHKAPPWEVAHRMLSEIHSQLRINVSGAIAGSKSAAKMATRLAKPNGLLYLEPDRAFVILRRLPVDAIPGVGKKAHQVLNREGIFTVGDLADSRPERIKSLFGKWGSSLFEIACGRDTRPVESEPRQLQKTYSKDRTLAADTDDRVFLRCTACELAEALTAKLRAENKAVTTVSLRVRYSDFSETLRSRSLKEPTNEDREIIYCVERLVRDTVKPNAMVRLVGVKLSGIADPSIQERLFDDAPIQSLQRDRAVDSVRHRFGFKAIRIARWGV